MIHVGMGGWTYEPWRTLFYPAGLPRVQELAHAARRVTAIEVNATFYRSQERATFQRWHDETPPGFVFTLKASRFATNRKDLRAALPAVEDFVGQGLDALGDKLGAILWQLAPTKRFDPDELEAYLASLPRTLAGRPLRHALEVRHPSFRVPEYVAIARRLGIATVFTDSVEYPVLADRSAPFAYLRLVRGDSARRTGYADAALDRIATAVRALEAGGTWELPLVAEPRAVGPGPVYAFFIHGAKERAPAAAEALIGRLAA